MKFEIEEYCKEYLEELEEFRRLITVLCYDLDNIDLQIELLLLQYKISKTKEKMRKRLQCS